MKDNFVYLTINTSKPATVTAKYCFGKASLIVPTLFRSPVFAVQMSNDVARVEESLPFCLQPYFGSFVTFVSCVPRRHIFHVHAIGVSRMFIKFAELLCKRCHQLWKQLFCVNGTIHTLISHHQKTFACKIFFNSLTLLHAAFVHQHQQWTLTKQ